MFGSYPGPDRTLRRGQLRAMWGDMHNTMHAAATIRLIYLCPWTCGRSHACEMNTNAHQQPRSPLPPLGQEKLRVNIPKAQSGLCDP